MTDYSPLCARPERVVISTQAARRSRQGHPWIYRDDVREANTESGSIVQVVDERGGHCCWACFSAASKITLRRISSRPDAIDMAFWEAALDLALAQRGTSLADSQGCVRLLHADGDNFPGLSIDSYAGHLVLQATTAWADKASAEVVRLLSARVTTHSVLARNDVQVRKLEGLEQGVSQVLGTTPQELEVEEAGIKRFVNPWQGHKTGLYLDQQHNHAMAPQWLHGRVLDLFCAEGGFAIPLAQAGCQVVAIDQSHELLQRGQRSAALNALQGSIEWREANAFDALSQIAKSPERFDAVVLDPPPFAKRRDARNDAMRGYRDLHRRALEVLAPQGRVLSFSCSYAISDELFEEAIRQGVSQANTSVTVLSRPGPGSDHVERLELPQSRYLRGLLLQATAL